MTLLGDAFPDVLLTGDLRVGEGDGTDNLSTLSNNLSLCSSLFASAVIVSDCSEVSVVLVLFLPENKNFLKQDSKELIKGVR